jgi:hypothetical protein
MSDAHLLPSNATPFEKALSLSTDAIPRVGGATMEMRGLKLRNPPPSFLPYLLYEYGLGPISRFFDDPRDCIAEGIAWQRVRGTQDAITRALDWVGYGGEHENFPVRRRRWNLFMLEMDRIRDVEEPDLLDIEYLAGLSVALRSRFWRGFNGYDVRALDYSRTKWGQSLYSTYSGARIRTNGAKWSFGRSYERDYTPTQDDLEALDVWIEDSEDPSLTWGEFTWEEEDVTWASSPADVRSRLMAAGVLAKSAWVLFRDEDGAVIGARRARVKRGVSLDATGAYEFSGARYAPMDAASTIYVEALTDFGDGYGANAASWSLLFNPILASGVKPGALWLSPAQMSGGVEIMPTVQEIEFGRTIRERVKALLRF